MTTENFDVIVVGAGITGLTATKRLVASGLVTCNLEASMFGGLVINVNHLDGAIGGSGADLASELMMELAESGASMLTESVAEITREGDMLAVTTDVGRRTARAIIVASGASLRRLGVPGESEFEYKGVSQCADCDGPMCKGQDVVVVGGGDSAVQEALVLADFCNVVHVVHRGPRFRARTDLAQAILERSNVTVWWESELEAILGGTSVDKVRVRSTANGGQREIPCVGVFAYIGLSPCCAFVPAAVSRDAAGALTTDAALETAVPGLFAAGAVRAGYKGMLSDAVEEANAAAEAVVRRLAA